MSRKKIENMHQAHGKIETKAKRTLDQILGDTGTSKYKTLDVSVYEARLSDMNKSDLQHHAVEVGIIPVDDRRILTDRLIKEFKRHAASYQTIDKPETSKLSQKAISILSGGR